MTRTHLPTSDTQLRVLGGSSTPIQPLPRLGRALGVDLWVKRDDLYPDLAGGNKARKMARLLPVLERRGCDAIVSTGSTCSNHARVVALAAAQRGWRSTLILHGARDDLDRTVNGRLLATSGSDLRFVAPDDIGPGLNAAMYELRRAGYNPTLIEGGGHTLEGTLAYVDALHELHEQRRSLEHRGTAVVVTACGTGSTHAGLHVASEALGGYRVIGVSIARPRDRASAIVERSAEQVRAHLNHRHPLLPLELYDDWTEGGYGAVSPRLSAVVRRTLTEEGLVLDPTYTGKAFLGLIQLVELGLITPGSQVWFVQTGGWSTIEPGGGADA